MENEITTLNSDKMVLRKRPFAFTEHGVTMLSSVLKAVIAVHTYG